MHLKTLNPKQSLVKLAHLSHNTMNSARKQCNPFN
jgi:hypothetical protein